ncbi:hypothetical protein [Mycoplasma todarodis]|uniref:Uncharacterized protein n=1 Tax=Mycoplasma todarodis TaxID=1937191 RepID=A0A4R0XNE9_9MOLU|nr:hypothetical protein [Mycoplasma todarodis]TCG12092.1 hypothetical protein C4B25_00155 [Mycoplasma todarodis]
MGKNKLIIYYGRNAAGKTRFFNNNKLNKEFITIDNIHEELEFKLQYGQKELNEIEAEFQILINKILENWWNDSYDFSIKNFLKKFPFLNSFQEFYKVYIMEGSNQDEMFNPYFYFFFDSLVNQLIPLLNEDRTLSKKIIDNVIINRFKKDISKWTSVQEFLNCDHLNFANIEPLSKEETEHIIFKEINKIPIKNIRDVNFIQKLQEEEYYVNFKTNKNLIGDLFSLDKGQELSKLIQRYKNVSNSNNKKNFQKWLSPIMNSPYFEDIDKQEEDGVILLSSNNKFSRGQMSVFNLINVLGMAEINNKEIIIDDMFESLDAINSRYVFEFLLTQCSITKNISLLTHDIIDIYLNDSFRKNKNNAKLEYKFINSNGDVKDGGPLTYSYAWGCGNANKKDDDLKKILGITYRVMNRQLGKYHKFFTSKRKLALEKHYDIGQTIFDHISNTFFHKRNKINPYFFGPYKNFIKSFQYLDITRFSTEMIQRIEAIEIKNKGKVKYKVAYDFLKEFWQALIDRLNNKNVELNSSILHASDLTITLE